MQTLIVIAITIIWFFIDRVSNEKKEHGKRPKPGEPGWKPPVSMPESQSKLPMPVTPSSWSDVMDVMASALQQAQDRDETRDSSESEDSCAESLPTAEGGTLEMDDRYACHENEALPWNSDAPDEHTQPVFQPVVLQTPTRQPKFSGSDIRKAVVWSEILGKPKSMRRYAR